MDILTYTILYSWGNKQSLTIALFAYTHHVPGRLVATANPPYAKQ